MDSIRMIERELTADQAYQRIQTELSRLGMTPAMHTLGQDVVAVQATFTDSKGLPVARGAGKGYAIQATIGALYETLEHYWTDSLPVENAHAIPVDYFADKAMFNEDLVRLITRQQHRQIACRRYTCPQRHDPFFYPLALTSPNTQQLFDQQTADCRALRRYSSNSGTAIGASYNEALLHAINECIERDAVSLFLLDHFYYQNHPPVRRITRPDHGDALGQLWADVEREIGAEVVLVDISTEFVARTFLAFCAAPGAWIHVFGSGCSLDPRHAAWRALTELVQLHHAAAGPEYTQHLLNAKRHLSPFPRLLRCLLFNPEDLLHRCAHSTVTLPEASPQRPLPLQIEQLTTDLQQHGRHLGVSTVHQTSLGTSLVNVVIPGLERFFVVSSGNVVIPHARGRGLDKQLHGVSS
ncbi:MULTISPECIES: YcaO-like family protein [unclassified Pseudomonas]|uniref:YcaO-like family protein n=1 Tax=unclassified Pseudomonas TaxID=196821 RepID=UPI001B33A2C2|nr:MULTISPECIES: YcaO-like family protein [unclassified Pseudomonas]MBP5943396.1 YcaO-like family protein [Pseudomonas sp. P9(2020)]MBZ9562311.1 YcaO-like family protein [Pseudomonas sp. P116]